MQRRVPMAVVGGGRMRTPTPPGSRGSPERRGSPPIRLARVATPQRPGTESAGPADASAPSDRPSTHGHEPEPGGHDDFEHERMMRLMEGSLEDYSAEVVEPDQDVLEEVRLALLQSRPYGPRPPPPPPPRPVGG